MGRGMAEVDMAHHLSGLIKADLLDRLAEKRTDLLVSERPLSPAGQQIRILITGRKGATHAEIVFDGGDGGLRNRDQPVLFELGLLDMDGALITAIMAAKEPQGLRDPGPD